MAEFRDDGWPLCPSCGEDELYCLFEHDHRTYCPVLTCYCCGWRGADPRALEHPDG